MNRKSKRLLRLEQLESRRLLTALALGDFDGDGHLDMAVGAPFEDVASVVDAGEVNVVYGSSTGLQTAHRQLWNQGRLADDVQAGDQFGTVLAAGDFNGDGFADLAVGVPNEDVFELTDAGAVNVIYGTRDGLDSTNHQVFHQGAGGVLELAEEFDRFGATLTVGDYDGDGYEDLAIGVPGENFTWYEDAYESEELRTFGVRPRQLQRTVQDAGAVHVLYGAATGLRARHDQLWSQQRTDVWDMAERYDQFGGALTSGDFNGDGRDDLAIGVPGESFYTLNDAAGAVNVLYGSRTGIAAAGNQFWHEDIEFVPGHANAWGYFGAALAVGDFDADGRDDLVIGSPGDISNAGAVTIIFGRPSRGLTGWDNARFQQGRNGVLGSPDPGDLFGTALATGDFDGDGRDDLAVGIPGEDVNGRTDAGAVQLFFFRSHVLDWDNQLLHQDTTGISGRADAQDHFGAFLAAGNLDAITVDRSTGFSGIDLGGVLASRNNDDLVILIPGEDSFVTDVGAAQVVNGSPVRRFTTDRRWFQGSSGLGGTPEEGDQLGGLPEMLQTEVSVLNSNPDADREILLNVNGARVDHPLGRYDRAVPPFDVDGDPYTFNRVERAIIQDFWLTTAEDFAPFQINVTTERPTSRSFRLVNIGGTDDEYDGVHRHIGVRDLEHNISWVFSGNIVEGGLQGRDVANELGGIISHELGHALNELKHKSDFDSTLTRIEEYSEGDRDWTPIMGDAHNTDRTIWTESEIAIGPNRIVGNRHLQDDIDELTDKLGLREDLHGDTPAEAERVEFSTQLIIKGIIEEQFDRDYFRFTVTSAGTLSINVLVNEVSPNLDSTLTLIGSSFRGARTVSPDRTLNSSIERWVEPGEYFVGVGGAANLKGDLGQYTLRMDFQPELTFLPPVTFVPPINTSDSPKAKEPNSANSLPNAADTTSFGAVKTERDVHRVAPTGALSPEPNQPKLKPADQLVSAQDDLIAADAVFAGDLWLI